MGGGGGGGGADQEHLSLEEIRVQSFGLTAVTFTS